MLAAGLGIFGLLAAAARFNDKASRVPYVSCFDELSALKCSPYLMHDWCTLLSASGNTQKGRSFINQKGVCRHQESTHLTT